MKTLTIKDLSIAEELDSKSMSAVRGGTCGEWKMPSCFPSYAPPHGSTTNITTTQSNCQVQSNPTGNGSAVFCGGIYANNEQSAVNYNGSGYPYFGK